MLVIVFVCKTGDLGGERKCTKSGIGVVSFLNSTVMRVHLIEFVPAVCNSIRQTISYKQSCMDTLEAIVLRQKKERGGS